MKKLSIFIIFALSISLFSACDEGKSKSELLIGTWKPTSITSTREMDAVEKEMFNLNNKDVIEKSLYVFKDKGVVEFSYDGEKQNWNWTISEDETTLNLKTADGEFKYKIKQLDEKSMILDDIIDEYNTQTTTYAKQQ